MASLSTFTISRPNPLSNPSTSLNPIQSPLFHLKKFQTQFPNSSISAKQSSYKYGSLRRHITNLKSATEDEQPLVPEEETAPAPDGEASDPTVSVPVSPLDVLTMFFQADGTMSEAAVPAITKALEEVEGISDLKVQLVEGIASVELKKQTTVQATGVASNLVEIIQGSGFKLQTLNLSFQDEEDSS